MRENIWEEMLRMREEMDSMMEHFFEHPRNAAYLPAPASQQDGKALTNWRRPLTDVAETENEYIVSAEIPGVDKNDIKVSVHDDAVEIKVEKKHEVQDKDEKKGYYRMERSYSGFYRCLRLPENVDADKIDAQYTNGVLEVKIPKVEKKEKKAREIIVK